MLILAPVCPIAPLYLRPSRSPIILCSWVFDPLLPLDPERWSKVLATKNIIEDHFKEMRAEDMTDEFLYSDASMREPFFFKNAEGLGKVARFSVEVIE